MTNKNHPCLNLKEEVKSIYIPDIPVHNYSSSPHRIYSDSQMNY
jgi:hypothetical protein